MRGYKEEGSTTTPFDMAVKNDLDRFHLVLDVLDRVPVHGSDADRLRAHVSERLAAHVEYIVATGEDLPEIRDWEWGR